MCYLMVLISFVQCDVVFLVLLILSRFNIFHRPAFSRLLVFIIGLLIAIFIFFFFQAEDGIRVWSVTGVQTCALPIWPTGDITGVGGAQPRHNRIGTCKSSAVDILRLAPDDKRKEEGGRGKSRPYKNNSGRRPLPGARNLFDEPRVTSCHSLFTTQGDFRRPLVYRGAASVTGRRTNAARG